MVDSQVGMFERGIPSRPVASAGGDSLRIRPGPRLSPNPAAVAWETPAGRVGKIRPALDIARSSLRVLPEPAPHDARNRPMDSRKIERFVAAKWDDEIVPQLVEYIRIPNKSPMFDADWAQHGYMDEAVDADGEAGRGRRPIAGMQVEVVRLEGRTPLIFIDIPAANGGSDDDCVLLYGHLDKQPEMTGWDDGLGPWKPVIKGDRLYGRGGADDGYAIFGSLTAILALQEQGVPHARCVVLIEACEESGSYDLPAYIDHLAERIGKPSLVVCLDSGCGNYDQLWCTTSLRGLAGGNFTVEVLSEGVHSGDASGIVPSSFRMLRQLLSRIEDEKTGRILLEGLHVEIPAERLAQAKEAAQRARHRDLRQVPVAAGHEADGGRPRPSWCSTAPGARRCR